MIIWVDDIRPAPKGCKWIKSVNEFKRWLEVNLSSLNAAKDFEADPFYQLHLDLDHDAGDFARDGGDYIEVLNYLEQVRAKIFVKPRTHFKVLVHIHTMNPVGAENMRRIIRKNKWEEI